MLVVCGKYEKIIVFGKTFKGLFTIFRKKQLLSNKRKANTTR